MTHLEKLAKEYEADNYFDYIIESQANGNFSQVRKLAKRLKRNELAMFCMYALMEYGGKEAQDTVVTLSKS